MAVSTTEMQTILVAQTPAPQLIQAPALQGPPGPAGAAPSLSLPAGAAISADTAVALINGVLVPAVSTDATQAGFVIGVALNAGASGTQIAVQQGGEMSLSSWNWTVGDPVYVGTTGPLTQTQPTSGYSQIIGVAVSATTILVGLQPAIVLG